MWGYMVCVIVKATKFYASLESLLSIKTSTPRGITL